DFSNKAGSLKSSLGIFVTGREYRGENGRSMRLVGLEDSNSNALTRDIVVHAADYVSRQFIRRNGRLGRSWGCPVIEKKFLDPLIGKLKGGSVFLVYGESPAR